MKFLIEGETVECGLHNGNPNNKGGMQVNHITCWIKYQDVYYPSKLRSHIRTLERLHFCTSISELKNQIMDTYP